MDLRDHILQDQAEHNRMFQQLDSIQKQLLELHGAVAKLQAQARIAGGVTGLIVGGAVALAVSFFN